MIPHLSRKAAARWRSLPTLLAILALLITPGLAFAAPLPPRASTAEGAGLPAEPAVTQPAYDDADPPFLQGRDPAALEAAYVPAGVEQFLPGFCTGNETCIVGDFNGDGKDDVAALVRDTQPEPARGDVYVALWQGRKFSPPTKWAESLCVGNKVCLAGNPNNDAYDDIVVFNHGGGAGTAQVYVARSNGASFLGVTQWHADFCRANEVCDIGNFDGTSGDDIVAFTHNTLSASVTTSPVWVAVSNGSTEFINTKIWHNIFCAAGETCSVGDVDGDSDDDVVAFSQATPGQTVSNVWVGLSNPATSVFTSVIWSKFFCLRGERCDVGDFNGDGRADVLAFLLNNYNPEVYGDVYVGLSSATAFHAGVKWHGYFCLSNEECTTGDFDGDGRDDLVSFYKDSRPGNPGGVSIALAEGEGVGFFQTPGNPPGRWHAQFCTGNETCLSGDFNGDGLADVARLVRNTQAGVGESDVFVSLSNGAAFQQEQKWADWFCVGTDVCQVGDFDNNGIDDLIAFGRNAGNNGQVWVALSTGNGFLSGELWNPVFCAGSEVCDVGDFDGDGRTDIVTFLRNAYTNDPNVPFYGDVRVALSRQVGSVNQFVTQNYNWHELFCAANEVCRTGDFNGDGRTDIVTFARSAGAVWVATSNGTHFVNTKRWNADDQPFCVLNEVCDVGDFNNDNRTDVAAFLRSDYQYTNPTSVGDVYVALSTGSAVLRGQLWNDFFCIGQQVCNVGDFNGDGFADIAAFLRSTELGDKLGDVYVALAKAGQGYHFYTLWERLLYLPMIRR